MQGQERVLRERFAQLKCAACGMTHDQDDMLVLAQRKSRWLVLLTCGRCQRRGIYVASFPRSGDAVHVLDTLEPATTHSAPLLNLPQAWLTRPTSDLSDDLDSDASLQPSAPDFSAPITQADVESVRHFLEDFNGDFQSLFGRADR